MRAGPGWPAPQDPQHRPSSCLLRRDLRPLLRRGEVPLPSLRRRVGDGEETSSPSRGTAALLMGEPALPGPLGRPPESQRPVPAARSRCAWAGHQCLRMVWTPLGLTGRRRWAATSGVSALGLKARKPCRGGARAPEHTPRTGAPREGASKAAYWAGDRATEAGGSPVHEDSLALGRGDSAPLTHNVCSGAHRTPRPLWLPVEEACGPVGGEATPL